MRVACIEKDNLGGTCLNEGCIPSKALLHSSHKYWEAQYLFKDHGIEFDSLNINLNNLMKRKNSVVKDLVSGISYLLKKNKITHIKGTASFISNNKISVNHDIFEGNNIIIATGSKPSNFPGISFDEKKIVSSTGALSLDHVPERMVVIGGGYIGLEMSSVWSRLGSQVTVVEFADRIVPLMDKEVSSSLFSILKKQGINFKLSTKLISHSYVNNSLNLSLSSDIYGSENLSCDTMLIATGRKPYTDSLCLDKIGVECDELGFIKVNSNYETSTSNVYAIGDVIGGAMLAHKAEEEGVVLVESLAGQKPELNYNLIPSIIYTHPEVAAVGQTEESLRDNGVEYSIGKFPFKANSRSRANAEVEGFVKILADKKSDEVLGSHIVGSNAGSLISEIVIAMEFKASSEDIARICHAHPTESEALKEAALDVSKSSIHM